MAKQFACRQRGVAVVAVSSIVSFCWIFKIISCYCPSFHFGTSHEHRRPNQVTVPDWSFLLLHLRLRRLFFIILSGIARSSCIPLSAQARGWPPVSEGICEGYCWLWNNKTVAIQVGTVHIGLLCFVIVNCIAHRSVGLLLVLILSMLIATVTVSMFVCFLLHGNLPINNVTCLLSRCLPFDLTIHCVQSCYAKTKWKFALDAVVWHIL